MKSNHAMNYKLLPKTRKIKHHFKLDENKEDFVQAYEKVQNNRMNDFLMNHYEQGEIKHIHSFFYGSFNRYLLMYHYSGEARYGDMALTCLAGVNELFAMMVRQRFSPVGTPFDVTLPLPAFLPQTYRQQVTIVTPPADYCWNPLDYPRWGEMLCYAISIHDNNSVDYLMRHTEKDAWKNHSGSKGYCGGYKEEPMFYVRYLKGMLDETANHQRLYQQLMWSYFSDFAAFHRTMLEPFYFIAIGDESGFVDAISRAAKINKKVYTGDIAYHSEPGMDSYSPFLLAAGVLAADKRGWAVPPNNEYLYPWWIYDQFELPLALPFDDKIYPRNY